jgi:hypothetical protein
MRLSKSQQGMLEKGVVAAAPVEDEHEHDEYQPEPERANVGTPPSSSAPMVEWALYWAEQGWNVFPLRVGAKEPLFPRAHDKGKQADCKGECGRDGHGAYDGTTDRDRIRRWWSKYPRANVGANLGDDRLVFDLDLEHGAVDLPFPATRSHPTGRGGGNRHLIYRHAPGSMASTIKGRTKQFGDSVDVRIGRGQYVVLPPSIHPDTKKPYLVDWDSPGTHVLADKEVKALFEAAGVPLPAKARAASKGISLVAPSSGRSRLIDLMENPPKRGQGKTNDWLAQVAGHLAKKHRRERDQYEFWLHEAISKVDATYEDFEKTAESIWDKEQHGHPERDASEANGFLVGDGNRLMCQSKGSEGPELEPYADFNLTCRGVAVDENDERSYWVTIHRQRDRDVETTVEAKVFANVPRLSEWIMAYGCSFSQPPNAFPVMGPGTRLQRYLESQDAPRIRVTPNFGWHPGVGFVTADGVIDAEGPRSHEDAGVVADSKITKRNLAAFRYGFETDWDTAQDVLRQVLTFQDETVTSVFGAWWAACLLKPQLLARTSVFPFFGVEATSESGKTNGFFDLMVQLNGNTKGQTRPTMASMRDMASANSSGIVWADDLDDLEQYGELLRSATSGGTSTKMDRDAGSVVEAQIVAPILITGEALGFSTQKALRDRAVLLDVPSPVGRMSLRGDYPQWEDVKDLQARFPKGKESGGLAVLAGWFVQAAMSLAEQTDRVVRENKRTGSGRRSDKFAVLTAGSMLLDAFVGHEDPFSGTGSHAVRVARWVAEQANSTELDKDNTVTLEMVPWALRVFGMVEEPEPGEGRFQGVDTPVLVRGVDQTLDSPTGVQVLVRVSSLADAWKRDRGRVEARTESASAIRQQLTALGATSTTVRVAGAPTRYMRLPEEYARVVLERYRS